MFPQKRRQQATAKLFRKFFLHEGIKSLRVELSPSIKHPLDNVNGNLPYCICPPWDCILPSGLHSQSTTRSCPELDFAPVQPSQSKEGGAYVKREKWMQGNLNNRSNFRYN